MEIAGLYLYLENYGNSINKLQEKMYDLVDVCVSSSLHVMACALTIACNRMPLIYLHVKRHQKGHWFLDMCYHLNF